MSSGWGCPHEFNGRCMKVRGHACDPAMKGCVLFGKFKLDNPDKQRPAGLRRPAADPGKDDSG